MSLPGLSGVKARSLLFSLRQRIRQIRTQIRCVCSTDADTDDDDDDRAEEE